MAVSPIEHPYVPEEDQSEENPRRLEAHPTPEARSRLRLRKKHGPISQKQMMGLPSDETTSELGREKEDIENWLINLIDESLQPEKEKQYPKEYYEARWLLRRLPEHIRGIVTDELVTLKKAGAKTKYIMEYLKNEVSKREKQIKDLPDHMPQSTKDAISKLHLRPEPRQERGKK